MKKQAFYGDVAKATPVRHGTASLSRVDLMPDSALVHSVVAEQVTGYGRTKIWELEKAGEIEAVRVGTRAKRYVLGSCRRVRRTLEANTKSRDAELCA